MGRVPQITDISDLDPKDHGIFEEIASSRDRISGPFSVLLNSPEVAGRSAHLGAYLRFESILENRVLELAIITAAREMDCDYEWAYHALLAKKAGVPESVIDLVNKKSDTKDIPLEFANVIQYTKELLNRKKVGQKTFDQISNQFGTQGTTELTAAIGYYGMLACALNAFEIMPEEGTPELF
jgi:4-carboxymuconolactone decarboxylase